MGDTRTSELEGVEGKLKKLQLSEAERKGIRIGRKHACSSKVSRLQAVGKLISEKAARAEHVGRALGAVWSPFAGVECKDLGRNRFLFSFHQAADKNKASDGGPWTFNRDLIVMEDFVPSKTIDEYGFKMIPIWVRAHGIPMGMMSRETGDLIGEQIGEVLDVDLDDNGDAMGEFMWIKVRMDITVPIMRFTTIIIEDDEEKDEPNEMIVCGNNDEEEKAKDEQNERIVSLKYEYLPVFCYSCGIIGHNEKACPIRTRRTGSSQFGPWLRAIIHKGSSTEERNRGSSDGGKFWMSNSTCSKENKHGSDLPSWRRNDFIREDVERVKQCEDKEGTCPPKKTNQETEPELAGAKKLVLDEEKLADDKKQKHEIQVEKGVEESIKEREHAAAQPTREKSDHKEVGSYIVEERNIQRLGKAVKQSTFKRVERPKGRQHRQLSLTGQKKRNADHMDVDEGTELMKKARMEVDGEDVKELDTTSDFINAGLQEQPGESK
ncbi:hypothetical protein ACQ4PT_034628 [Festuca glaucescens]